MKQSFLSLILIMTLCTGCSTVKDWLKSDSAQEQAYRAGRVATVAYLTKEDKMDADKKAAVQQVYKTFDELMSADKEVDVTGFQKLLQEQLKGKLKPKQLLIANELVGTYMKKLLEDVKDSDTVKGSDLYSLLKQFHKGIKNALDEHKALLE
jgi:hypothetical protein